MCNALVAAVESCKKSPRSDNMLVRVLSFSSSHPNGVKELHGFKALSEIDTADYPKLRPGGLTPLCDACYSAIGAMNAYGKRLVDQDFGVNGIGFVITDGGSNQEELSLLGKRTLLMRGATERREGLDDNVVLSGYDTHIVDGFVDDALGRPADPVAVLPSVRPSAQIAAELRVRYQPG